MNIYPVYIIGHGTKTTVNSPKQLESMSKLYCTQISCGAYHTGIIASEYSKILYIPIPERFVLTNNNSYSNNERFPVVEDIHSSKECFECGDLYCCGLGKAGQLGLPGDVKKLMMRLQKVIFFESNNLLVAKVSCGFHHTLALACPKDGVNGNPSVYAFGWNEHGRLGVGDEEQRMLPEMVSFDGNNFYPTCISAGEQHSMACNRDVAYSWGSNAMGQLGQGNPTTTEMMLTPQKIPLPEGMKLRMVVAGGRHSGALTECNRVLTWGWAEEVSIHLGRIVSSLISCVHRVKLDMGMKKIVTLQSHVRFLVYILEMTEKWKMM